MNHLRTKHFIALFIAMSTSQWASAQAGIGTTSPHPSAQLDIQSESKGLLIPRMTSAARTGIQDPAEGLMVYQTGDTSGFYYYNGSQWSQIGGNAGAGASATPAGFSAKIQAQTFIMGGGFQDWSTAYPYYGSPDFNPVSGKYTVSATGRYSITATIPYRLSSSQSENMSDGATPAFSVTKLGPPPYYVNADLLIAPLPTLDVNIPLVLNMRALMGRATVTLAGTVDLTAGEVIQLQYISSGTPFTIQTQTYAGWGGGGVVWTVTKIN